MKKHIKDALTLNTAVLSIKYNREACKYDHTAFAELEAAVMRAEKAMEAQRWIPVSERFPEDCRRLWVYDSEKRNIHVARYDQGEFHNIEFSYHDRQNRNRILSNITHWMPVPDAPLN